MSLLKSLFVRIVLGITLFFQGCANDIDINANWKEVMVVYGLLNPTDSVHYLKINKAFLNEKTNALEAASVSDSLFFEDLEVRVVRQEDQTVYPCEADNSIQKDSGIFANDRNTLWTFRAKISQFNTYRLEILRKSSGKKIEASTLICGQPAVFAPIADTFSTLNLQLENIPVIYNSGLNTAAYDIRMDFIYDEFSVSDTSKKSQKTITWRLITDQRTNNYGGNVRLTNIIPRTAFFQFIASQIKVDATLRRRAKYVAFTFYGGAPQLVDYISVSEPSIGIVQKQAEYSNITGALGIFSSRHIYRIPKVKFDQNSLLLLIGRPEIRPLNFVY
jgi:hypothetical protein